MISLHNVNVTCCIKQLFNRHGGVQPFNLEFTSVAELKNSYNNSLFHVAAQLKHVLVLGTRHKVSFAVKFTKFQCNVEPECAFFCNERAVRENARRLGQTPECSCKAVQKLCDVLHVQANNANIHVLQSMRYIYYLIEVARCKLPWTPINEFITHLRLDNRIAEYNFKVQ